MLRAGLPVLLFSTLAFAGEAPDVDEPDSLPPPREPVEPARLEPPLDSGKPASFRRSVTIEAAIGAGVVLSNMDGTDSGAGLAGLDLGVGGFVRPQLAITGRFAGVLTQGSNNVAAAFFGGSAQLWIDDRLWVGAGAGLAYAGRGQSSSRGLALDLRAGYTIRQRRAHAYHASIEVNPMFIEGEQLLAFALLAGYQYL